MTTTSMTGTEVSPFLPASFPLPTDRPFTRRQAYAAGLSPRDLTRLHADGLLRSPVRGVHLATEAGDSLLLRARSLALVVPRDAVVCDRHAGWLLGAEMALAPGEHLELRPVSVFRPSGRGRVRAGLADSGERNLRPGDVTEVHGLRVTTPLRTAHDLGRVRRPDAAIAGMDAVSRLGVDLRALLAGVERYAGMRWVTTLRAIAPLVDPRAESPPESVLRLRCLEAGAGSLRPQVGVRENGREVARLDLGDDRLRLAVEYDGDEWHSSPEQRAHDRARREHLTRVHGWTILVVRGEELFGRDQVLLEARIRRALVEARRRAGDRIAG